MFDENAPEVCWRRWQICWGGQSAWTCRWPGPGRWLLAGLTCKSRDRGSWRCSPEKEFNSNEVKFHDESWKYLSIELERISTKIFEKHHI